MQRVLAGWAGGDWAVALYPQRQERRGWRADGIAAALLGRWKCAGSSLRRRHLARLAAVVAGRVGLLEAADDGALREQIEHLRARLPSQSMGFTTVGEIFALVSEVLNRQLGLRPHPQQLMGAYALTLGQQVEMATGEGKSMTAVIAGIAVGLFGVPVHIVTVNDYLARRDAQRFAPIYGFFGLSAGWIESEQDPSARRAMYACDITYCVNKDLVFDYLRDHLGRIGRASVRADRLSGFLNPSDASVEPMLRGLCFAIVDEADSIFIDEARTPLILSRTLDSTGEAEVYRQALDIARGLDPVCFEILPAARLVRLLPAASPAIAAASAGLGGSWGYRKAREELVRQALSALHLYERGVHYVVVDGAVQIVDEFTGRTLPDRSWQAGLHQLIETLEGLEPTAGRDTIARLTYQRFFRRYLRLSGMTGTGAEVAGELRAVFGLDTVCIPTHRRCVRRNLGERVFLEAEERWQEVVRRARQERDRGRAVLIGTRSVQASQHLSTLLNSLQIPHALLNALQDEAEAEIVARAGEAGTVTVATNMAGRGTDILLDPGVREAGGLHVILTEYHESRRIDRQLYGRAGRQGDPGSHESLVALDDGLFLMHAPRATQWMKQLLGARRSLPAPLGAALRWLAQREAEALNARTRRRTLESERSLDQSLAFSGRGE